jgi:hypothetical protein
MALLTQMVCSHVVPLILEPQGTASACTLALAPRPNKFDIPPTTERKTESCNRDDCCRCRERTDDCSNPKDSSVLSMTVNDGTSVEGNSLMMASSAAWRNARNDWDASATYKIYSKHKQSNVNKKVKWKGQSTIEIVRIPRSALPRGTAPRRYNLVPRMAQGQ